jgi:hypothetical protein
VTLTIIKANKLEIVTIIAKHLAWLYWTSAFTLFSSVSGRFPSRALMFYSESASSSLSISTGASYLINSFCFLEYLQKSTKLRVPMATVPMLITVKTQGYIVLVQL